MEITKREVKKFEERKFPQKVVFEPIGIVRSEFKTLKGIPIQFSMSQSKGTLEIFEKFVPGLKDLDGFSHLYCLYYFDLVKLPVPLQSKPFLKDEIKGVFSIRTPFRPNPIGLSILKILSIEGNKIQVGQLDILDKTPILDIKPYSPDFDTIYSEKSGWMDGHVKNMTS